MAGAPRAWQLLITISSRRRDVDWSYSYEVRRHSRHCISRGRGGFHTSTIDCPVTTHLSSREFDLLVPVGSEKRGMSREAVKTGLHA